LATWLNRDLPKQAVRLGLEGDCERQAGLEGTVCLGRKGLRRVPALVWMLQGERAHRLKPAGAVGAPGG